MKRIRCRLPSRARGTFRPHVRAAPLKRHVGLAKGFLARKRFPVPACWRFPTFLSMKTRRWLSWRGICCFTGCRSIPSDVCVVFIQCGVWQGAVDYRHLSWLRGIASDRVSGRGCGRLSPSSDAGHGYFRQPCHNIKDEAATGSTGTGDGGGPSPGGAGEQSPSQSRAIFLKNQDGKLVVRLPEGACVRGGT